MGSGGKRVTTFSMRPVGQVLLDDLAEEVLALGRRLVLRRAALRLLVPRLLIPRWLALRLAVRARVGIRHDASACRSSLLLAL